MSFKIASRFFNEALRVSQQKNDENSKFIVLGLIELTSSIEEELSTIKKTINDIDSDVKSIR